MSPLYRDGPSGPARLELVYDPETRRHYVEGYGLHCGDFIDVMIDGQWVEGRYEATWDCGREPRAFFYFGDKVKKLVDGDVCRRGTP